jgi:hypothetical protein
MVTTFCLRLALGMVAPMLILPAAIVPPRFFRVQFLSALALIVIASFFLPDECAGDQRSLAWFSLISSGIIAVLGGLVWHTEEAPAGRMLMGAGTIGLLTALMAARVNLKIVEHPPLTRVDDLASALMLGSAVSAMLMGHSYLIAPAMSLSPLNRLLGLMAVALAIRIGLACAGLYVWTRQSTGSTLDIEAGLWLGARWLVGLFIPVGLTWMAWETARIRSTQSATGILYVVTILVFLGELLSMLLIEKLEIVM